MGPFSAVRGYTTKLTGMSSEAHPHVERLPEVRARVVRRPLKQRSSHSSGSALALYAQPPEVAAQSASLLKTEEGLTDTMVRLHCVEPEVLPLIGLEMGRHSARGSFEEFRKGPKSGPHDLRAAQRRRGVGGTKKGRGAEAWQQRARRARWGDVCAAPSCATASSKASTEFRPWDFGRMSFSVRRVAESPCWRSSIPSACSMPLLLECGAQPLADRSARSMKNRHAKEQTCRHSPLCL